MYKALLILAFIFINSAHAESSEKSYAEIYAKEHGTCSSSSCPPGTKVMVSLAKGDLVFACDTEERATYTNFVLGMVSFMHDMTGRLPNISPTTGEPEVTGQSKEMLDSLRASAGVKTFDEATSKCLNEKKVNKKHFMMLNVKNDSDYAWVGSDSNKLWVPLTAIKPVK
ncbi:hypothetical protein [Enterobacter asburiae]|uniref:hypothetical protein n=2 Tax=Enterobacter asburiae TaxID=61645 RepID=UPI000BB67C98|nr:hypothetical protein [Enterobacter asburiae]